MGWCRCYYRERPIAWWKTVSCLYICSTFPSPPSHSRRPFFFIYLLLGPFMYLWGFDMIVVAFVTFPNLIFLVSHVVGLTFGLANKVLSFKAFACWVIAFFLCFLVPSRALPSILFSHPALPYFYVSSLSSSRYAGLYGVSFTHIFLHFVIYQYLYQQCSNPYEIFTTQLRQAL